MLKGNRGNRRPPWPPLPADTSLSSTMLWPGVESRWNQVSYYTGGFAVITSNWPYFKTDDPIPSTIQGTTVKVIEIVMDRLAYD